MVSLTHAGRIAETKISKLILVNTLTAVSLWLYERWTDKQHPYCWRFSGKCKGLETGMITGFSVACPSFAVL
jgi:hypothetical protein